MFVCDFNSARSDEDKYDEFGEYQDRMPSHTTRTYLSNLSTIRSDIGDIKENFNETNTQSIHNTKEREMIYPNTKARATTHPMNTMIKLNVGGKIFYTTIKTLRNQKCILNNIATNESTFFYDDSTQCFFIDRDSKHFSIILNYLRYLVLCSFYVYICV